MKKNKTFILPFALVLALLTVLSLSAFTGSTKKAKTTDYYWFNDLGYTQRHQSKALEVIDSECPDTGELICETGYSDDDFVTFGDPDSGFKDGAEPDEFIMKVE